MNKFILEMEVPGWSPFPRWTELRSVKMGEGAYEEILETAYNIARKYDISYDRLRIRTHKAMTLEEIEKTRL